VSPSASGPETSSLQRGLRVMQVLVDGLTPLTLSEIATQTGLTASTLHRLLQDLARGEYIVRCEGRRYMASPKALMPLGLYHPLNLLRRDAAGHLLALRDQFQLTSSLVVFIGVERLALDIAASNETLSPYYDTYLRSPLHTAASGKILLAALPPDQRHALLGDGPYTAHTGATITDPQRLAQDLAEVRSRGYATALDETFNGISAIAAPVQLEHESPVGCFVLAGESERFRKAGIAAIGEALRDKGRMFAFGAPAMKVVRGFLGHGQRREDARHTEEEMPHESHSQPVRTAP